MKMKQRPKKMKSTDSVESVQESARRSTRLTQGLIRQQKRNTVQEDLDSDSEEHYESLSDEEDFDTDDISDSDSDVSEIGGTKPKMKSQQKLKDHKRRSKESSMTNAGSNSLTCHFCLESFQDKPQYQSHMALHLPFGDRPFRCDECGKCYSDKFDLKMHEKTHIIFKPFKCHICDKCFAAAKSLKSHIAKHTGKTRFNCTMCDSSFFYSAQLDYHMQKHSPKKSHVCHHCGKGFPFSGSLNRHLMVHAGLKPYQCDLCDKKYRTAAELRNHVPYHTGVKRYHCDLCDKVFIRAMYLARHKKRHNKQKKDSGVSPTNSETHEPPKLQGDTSRNNLAVIEPPQDATMTTSAVNETSAKHEDADRGSIRVRHIKQEIANEGFEDVQSSSSESVRLTENDASVALVDPSAGHSQPGLSGPLVKTDIAEPSGNVQAVSAVLVDNTEEIPETGQGLTSAILPDRTQNSVGHDQNEAKSSIGGNTPQGVTGVVADSSKSCVGKSPCAVDIYIDRVSEGEEEEWELFLDDNDDSGDDVVLSEGKPSRQVNENRKLDARVSPVDLASSSDNCQQSKEQFSPQCSVNLGGDVLSKKNIPNDCIANATQNEIPKKLGSKKYRKGKTIICEVCGKLFLFPVHLKNHMVRHSEERPLKCPLCDKKFKDKAGLRYHKRTHLNLKPFKCDQCGECFTLKNSRDKHVSSVHLKLRPYRCDVCGKTYGRLTHLQEHKNRHHLGPNEQRPAKNHEMKNCTECGKRVQARSMHTHMKVHTLQKDHKCAFCGKEFIWRRSYRRHMEIHSNERPFKCDICQKTFTSEGAYNSHLKNSHGEKNFICEVCNKGFVSQERLDKHMHVHNPDEKLPFPCTLCPKSFHHSSGLKSHMIVHNQEQKFQCSECGTTFSRSSVLRKHQLTHSSVGIKKNVPCTLCNKMFVDKYRLSEHMRVHTGERPYKCNFCPKDFVNRKSWKIHMSNHTGDKPFSCDICGKSYLVASLLKTHQRSHMERKVPCDLCDKVFASEANVKIHKDKLHNDARERRFICDQCGKKFFSKHDLKVHQAYHTGEKTVPCSVCERKFFNKQHLKDHMLSHTGEKPFACDSCGKAFQTRFGLRKHVGRHHTEIEVKNESTLSSEALIEESIEHVEVESSLETETETIYIVSFQ